MKLPRLMTTTVRQHRLALADLAAFFGCFVLPVLGAAALVGVVVIALLVALYR